MHALKWFVFCRRERQGSGSKARLMMMAQKLVWPTLQHQQMTRCAAPSQCHSCCAYAAMHQLVQMHADNLKLHCAGQNGIRGVTFSLSKTQQYIQVCTSPANVHCSFRKIKPRQPVQYFSFCVCLTLQDTNTQSWICAMEALPAGCASREWVLGRAAA